MIVAEEDTSATIFLIFFHKIQILPVIYNLVLIRNGL